MAAFNRRPAAPGPVDAPVLRRAALDLLARREHSRSELQQKLRQRFGTSPLIDEELDRLESESLLDDARFAEAFVRMHRNRGHGPLRILHELAPRGVATDLAEACVEPRSPEWIALARQWRERRFGESPPDSAAERQRQARHLQSRGFSMEQVNRAFRPPAD
ncbi:MAG: regulatory protein RecX [Gammaproteobacteria bacterium]